MLIYTKNIVVWKKMDYSPHILNRKEKKHETKRVSKTIRTGVQ